MVRRRALTLLVSLLAGCCANTYDKESRLHASVNTAVGTGCARINTARMTDPVLADESYWGNGFYFEMFVDGWSREKQVTVEVGEPFQEVKCDQTVKVVQKTGQSFTVQLLGSSGTNRFGCSPQGIHDAQRRLRGRAAALGRSPRSQRRAMRRVTRRRPSWSRRIDRTTPPAST